jgi:hypothetical protein
MKAFALDRRVSGKPFADNPNRSKIARSNRIAGGWRMPTEGKV